MDGLAPPDDERADGDEPQAGAGRLSPDVEHGADTSRRTQDARNAGRDEPTAERGPATHADRRSAVSDRNPPDHSAPWLSDAPLFQAWRRFVDADVAPFTIPGHKRRASALDPGLGRLLDADVPLYGGADTVKLDVGVLVEAQRRAAALWGADLCRFSTGGSTHANQVACMSVAGPGATVLVARNAHRSVLGGLVLAGARPVWLDVEIDSATGGPACPTPSTVAAALRRHHDAVAVLVTDPGYTGVLGDLAGVVAAAHADGVPVVVDQAWGAHLGLAPGYPPHALALGADVVVTSAHKMLPSFSQAAVVLARTERIDRDRLERAFDATHTTSPSAAILASIDAARAFLGSPDGREALRDTARLVREARERLRTAGVDAPGPDSIAPGRFDPAKLVIRFAASGHSGLVVEAALQRLGVPVEMADRDTVVAQVGLTDDEGSMGRLVDGVLAACSGPAGPRRSPVVTPISVAPQRMTPRDAFFAPYRVVPRSDAVGLVCAELVAPYPPGVPVLVPGEEITAAALDVLDASLAAGNRIAYAADPSLRTLHVVDRTGP